MTTRHHSSSRHGALRQTRATLLGGVSAFGIIVTLALALGVSPAAARTQSKALHKEADRTGVEPFGNVPKGPVQIFVSINQQKLHVYSDGTHVADTSVATGVPRLPTPTGVFSVIQKQVFHRSNLYSDAPMPFMQRITWSGVALHEGENIGHPASHGCIRMPGEFAARLYKFTRIGARVIVSRGELKPTDFTDPHLFVHKDMQAASLPVSGAIEVAQTTDANTASDAGPAVTSKPAEKPADLGLRGSRPDVTTSFVLTSDDAKPDAAKPAAAAAAKSDAAASDAPKLTDAAKPAAADTTNPEAANPEAAKPDAATADAAKPDPAAAATAQTQTQPQAPKVEADKANMAADTKASPPDVKAEAPAATGSTPAAVTPVSAAPEAPRAKPADATTAPVIKKSPIAIFISRKERKVFVRQDFEPVFEEAITIDQPEQSLGTHVFTAMEYLADNSTFRWNVVSMPGEPPKMAKSVRVVAAENDYARRGKHRHDEDVQANGELPSPTTPQQALARIELPQDAIDFISQRIVPGSSLIVSDQGLGEETGEGTDFIVVTR